MSSRFRFYPGPFLGLAVAPSPPSPSLTSLMHNHHTVQPRLEEASRFWASHSFKPPPSARVLEALPRSRDTGVVPAYAVDSRHHDK
ncbi:hypothetical protein ACRALDRAFT_1065174 [Sodiomyces alcalophilus JCM 7366]|uniref:uncharacterized protein n=1 Tax=Sodiomyces alcalophilus JCM 7366 TaxID=591952 RepID=UPI0039B6B279